MAVNIFLHEFLESPHTYINLTGVCFCIRHEKGITTIVKYIFCLKKPRAFWAFAWNIRWRSTFQFQIESINHFEKLSLCDYEWDREPFVNRKTYLCLPTNLMYFNHDIFAFAIHITCSLYDCCFYEDIQIEMRTLTKVQLENWAVAVSMCNY